MATRQTTHILKNSNIVNRPLPSSLLQGEPIVNTADGIVYFSGVTSSTNNWTPAGTGTTANFFEAGSNLYDLKLRNKITAYSGITNLSGKFLSGTTSGFVLADTSSIAGIDTYVTGFTYSNNLFTIKQNNGQSDLTASINTMTGLTVNGTFSATTYVGNGSGLTGLPYVTGGTVSYVDAAGTATFTNSTGGTFNVTGFKDVFTTGGTYAAGTTTFTNNDGTTYQVTGLSSTDTYVTGLTYNPTSNLITLAQNQGQVDKTINITSMSGITLSNLTAGRVVYVGTGGLLTDEAGFTYDAGTNTFSVPSDGTVNVGTGGLNVAGDAVIQGSLTVFGPSISAFTNQLYVEDPNISLNYNPTGNTTVTSIGAGWTVQDGNGVNGGNVDFNINRLDTLTGLTSTQVPSVTEYTTSTGYANRGWVTQLNDIVIRSTNVNTPNGVRVITEFDVLDGGFY
jgi:hypothetical protein